MNPRRVGVVTTSYPRFDGDAAGSFVAAHVAWMQHAGLAVEVVAAGDPRVVAAAGVHRVAAARGLFYAGGAPDALEAGASSSVNAATFAARLALACRRRAPQWDGVVAHWLAPSALAALVSRGPLLAIAHGGDVHTLMARGLLPTTIALLAARRARLAFVSPALFSLVDAATPRALRPWLARASIVTPMGIDLARFATLVRSTSAPTPPRVLVLARLVPIKGVDVLLAALPYVRTPIAVVIAGDGPQRSALHAAIPPLPPHISLHWCGEVDATSRDALLADAALVVIPSRALPSGRSEGTPMVALEALAVGIPLVVTRTGGLADLPAPVVHVTPDDPRALAAAIDAVLAAPPTLSSLRELVADRDWSTVGPLLHAHWLG